MRVVLAGGGTGGHLFPGIALAEALPSGSCHFLCTRREFDRRNLSVRDFPFTAVGRWNIRRAMKVIRRHHADVVVGLGGGGAFAGLLAAKLMRIPFACLEQNVLPGRLNRLAARWSSRFYSQWEEAKNHLPGINGQFLWSGSPLRHMKKHSPVAARMRYGLSSEWPTILVLGGSQGAKFLNREIPEAASWHRERVQFLHLTGSEDRVKSVSADYKQYGIQAAVRSFEPEMDWAYSASNLAVSRAGAMAIAELCRFRIPSLLIPYPHARDDHQALNAKALADAGGAILVREKDFSDKVLAGWIDMLVSNDPVINNMRRALGSFDHPDACTRIVDDLGGRVCR